MRQVAHEELVAVGEAGGGATPAVAVGVPVVPAHTDPVPGTVARWSAISGTTISCSPTTRVNNTCNTANHTTQYNKNVERYAGMRMTNEQKYQKNRKCFI